MKHSVAIGLAPNYQADDVRLALQLLAQPWQWRGGDAPTRLEAAFRDWLQLPYAISFGSGRAALTAVVKALELPSDAEVAVQAFTCVAVPDAVLWAGARPLYVDIDPRTYTMDPLALEAGISPRTRAVVVQHTFGIAADLRAISAIARQHRLTVIEDCAHAVGSAVSGRLCGQSGDAAIFSFGRDKCLSAVFGGVAVTPQPDLAERIVRQQQRLSTPPAAWIGKQLIHPLITSCARATLGKHGVGEAVLGVSKALQLLSRAVEPAERQGNPPSFLGYRLAPALAVLAVRQFEKRERFIRHRENVAERYQAALAGRDVELPPPPTPERHHVYLRYPIATSRRDALISAARQAGFHLGDWYDPPIAPAGVDESIIHYRRGSCPRAEAAARRVVNLPTHINLTDARLDRLIMFLQRYFFAPS